jgi:hypothetical protein
MRMWMAPPSRMCNSHLLGEHVETHMFLGALRNGTRLDGYVDMNCLEISSLISRHEELAKEMLSRGMKHTSPFEPIDKVQKYLEAQSDKVKNSVIDREASIRMLKLRCVDCRKRMEKI